jgi:hypothetical protein
MNNNENIRQAYAEMLKEQVNPPGGKKIEDIYDLIDDLEANHPNFIRWALETKGVEKFYSDFTSGKYKWKFLSAVSDKSDRLDAMGKLQNRMVALSKDGWRDYDSTDNGDQAAAVLWRKK